MSPISRGSIPRLLRVTDTLIKLLLLLLLYLNLYIKIYLRHTYLKLHTTDTYTTSNTFTYNAFFNVSTLIVGTLN